MKPLTFKQKTIFDFIEHYCSVRGFPPTLREIAQGTGVLNISAVRGHVAAIEKKGYIQKDADKARSIRIIANPSIFSRLKRQLHEFVRTNDGILHNVIYGIILVTRKKRLHFAGPHKDWINDILRKEAVEHGWEILAVQIEPDHLILQMKVWPNHSPGQVVSRIKQAGDVARLLCLKEFPGKSLWAKQHAVTTEPEELNQVKDLLLELVVGDSE